MSLTSNTGIASAHYTPGGGAKNTKVFISYSRKDKASVSRLHDRLAAHEDITIFRDTDDILPAEEWQPRLESLIHAADCIVFALSPHSAASVVCKWEVELAEGFNKRIIPVVIEDVTGDVPEGLSKLNYIHFTADHDPDEAIKKTVAAIDTDIDWVREHTRLAELSARWDAARLRGAQTLRGRELSEAEQWLASQPLHAPNPTALHRRFIYESRRAETRRVRRNSVAMLVAAVVFAVLAVVSFLSYKQANDSFVLALLTKADRLVSQDLPSRVLVVAGAINLRGWLASRLERLGLIVPKDDQSVRIRTLARIAGPASTEPVKWWRYSSAATSVASSRSGNLFAVGYSNGEVHVRSTGDGGETMRLVQDKDSGRVWGLEFGPDDSSLASFSSNEVVLWDLTHGTAVRFCETRSVITALAFDPQGRYLVWTLRDGSVVVLDLARETRTVLEEFQSSVWAAAFSPSGAYFVSSSGDGLVAIRDTTDWSVFKKFKTDRSDLVDVSINVAETRLATSSVAGPVDVWDITADAPEAVRQTLSVPDDKRWKVQYSPDGQWLALSSWEGTVRFWEAGSLKYRGTIDGHDLRVNDIAFITGSSWFLTAAESGVARLWSMENLRPMFLSVRGDTRETLAGVYSPDGTKFASGGKTGAAKLFAVSENGELEKICEVPHPNWVYSLSFSPDSTLVGSVSLDTGATKKPGTLKVWRAGNCEVVRAMTGFSDANVGVVAYSPAGDLMAWGTSAGEIWLTDTSGGGNVVRLPQVHTALIGEIDFSLDGKYLVSGGEDGRVIVWDMATRKVFRELKGHKAGEYVWTVKFSANGAILASGGTEGHIIVWDITKPPGAERIETLLLPGGANRLAFDHSGSVLAVGSGKQTVSMWSTQDWRKTFQLNAHVGIRSVFDFHPKRGDLAFDGAKGLIRIYLKRNVEQAVEPGEDVVLEGMDVFFDRVGVNVGDGSGIRTVQAPAGACG